MVEAVIIYRLPPRMSNIVGRIIVRYAALEYKLNAAIAVMLQLQRVEWRLVLKEPRVHERLETIQDLLALRDITIATNFEEFSDLLETVNRERDQIAHGIWLQHPVTKKIYLRLTKGMWKRTAPYQNKIKRPIAPQSILFGVEECRAVLARIDGAIKLIQVLGREIDAARKASPGKFRSLSPVVNPLGHRTAEKQRAPRPPSRGSLQFGPKKSGGGS